MSLQHYNISTSDIANKCDKHHSQHTQ